MNNDPKKWHGNERRTCPNQGVCMDHAGLVERIKYIAKKMDSIENLNPVPYSNHKWAIGVLASALISLFSISIYLAIDTKRELSTISSKQETTIYKISDIQQDIEELKRQIRKP